MTAALTEQIPIRRQSLKCTLGGLELFSMRFAAIEQPGAEAVASEGAEPLHSSLLDANSSADTVVIRDLPVDRIPRITLGRQIRYAPVTYQRYYVEMAGSFAEYLKGLSQNSRKNLLRHMRKFEEASGGKIEWKEFRHPSGIAEFYQVARAISKTTYQDRLNEGLPDSEPFRSGLQDMAVRDEVRGYILYLNQAPVAFRFCTHLGSGLLGQQTGYDPAFAQWSPGMVLLYLILQRLFAEGRYARYDFGESEQPYKVSYSNTSVRCARVYYFRRTVRNLAMVITHIVCNAVSSAAGRLLQRAGVKKSIRNWIRSYAPSH